MPQLISSLVFGLSFVLEEHAANELEWLHPEGLVVNRHDLGTPSESRTLDTCRTDRRPNPAPMDTARPIAQSPWYKRCRIRSALAAMIVVAAGSFNARNCPIPIGDEGLHQRKPRELKSSQPSPNRLNSER